MAEGICEIKHKAIDRELGAHKEWLEGHDCKLDILNRNDATNTNSIATICKSIDKLSKSIWWFVTTIGATFISFLVWYIQTKP